ncbi:MAG: hypothetical protein AAF907_03170 [Planctomycetota bacterium]
MFAALTVLAVAPLTPGALTLERPNMPKSDADVVAVGTVRDVYTSGAGTRNVRRITLLQIESVERGQELADGRYLHIHTSENQLAWREVGAGGHNRFRAPGTRVKVWLTGSRGGLLTGLYPEWYEVLPPKGER